LVRLQLQKLQFLELPDGIEHATGELVAIESEFFQVDEVAELLWDGADELAPLQVKVREVKKVGGPRHYLASNEAEDTHELGAPGTSDPG
jgi:hypothetical protein